MAGRLGHTAKPALRTSGGEIKCVVVGEIYGVNSGDQVVVGGGFEFGVELVDEGPFGRLGFTSTGVRLNSGMVT
jgi:hypothetical protein